MSTSNGELCSCKYCNNLFLYASFGPKICTSCKEKEDKQYHLVKEYILIHTGASVKEVSSSTNVSPTKIKSFLREGRLIIPDSSPIFLDCELCSSKIKYGHVCSDCASTLNDKEKAALNVNEFTIGQKPNPSSSSKLRFLSSHVK